MAATPPDSGSLSTLFLRISPEDIVLYANRAVAEYLGVPKLELVGSPVEALRERAAGEIRDCFRRPDGGRTASRFVTDAAGRVFEAKSYSDAGLVDIVLDEVTNPADSIASISRGVGARPEELSEEELRSIWHPDRRFLTVARTRLCGGSLLNGDVPPMEARLVLSAFVEECGDAILESGGAVGDVTGAMIESILGAPRYYRDHALRALRAVFEQFQKASSMRLGGASPDKDMPPLAAGIGTADALVATLHTPVGSRFAVFGAAPGLSEQLCRLARPGEILISEFTLQAILRELPPGWEFLKADTENVPDVSDVQWIGDEIQPLPQHMERVVYLVGPEVSQHPEQVEIYMDYLYAVKSPGHDAPVPVLRAVRPEAASGAIELTEESLSSAPAVQVLGKYKLIEVVGEGGMGRVWKGQDRFGNTVAIKVLSAAETATDAQIRRFQREAEIMARLPHRNICRVFEISEFEGIPYIVMEYVDGLSLAELLTEDIAEDRRQARVAPDLRELIHLLRQRKQQGGEENPATPAARPDKTRVLPLEQTLNLFNRICEAVQFAHEHGVLHRDLKPGNVLLREDGEPLVADFGLAKLETADASLSVSGHVVGTIENMAPEQAESSKDVDERADVYSLGTILYQLLTGHRHFQAAGNLVTDAQALKSHEPIRLRQWNPRIESDLEVICLKCLRSDPAERYRSVAALLADLGRFRKGEVITAKPVTAVDLVRKLVQRNRAVSAVAAAACVLFLAGSAAAFWMINEQRLEAERERVVAEEHARRAEEALAVAEERGRAAEAALAQQLFAEEQERQAREEAERAREAEKIAAADRAVAEQASREAIAEREAIRKNLDEQEAAISEHLAALESRPEPEAEPAVIEVAESREPRRDERFREAGEAFRRAAMVLNFEFSARELQRHARSPEVVLDRLSVAMDDVSKALMLDGNYPPALLLKGRLHLAGFELEAAQEAFERAAKGGRTGGGQRDEDPEIYLEMIRETREARADGPNVLAEKLLATHRQADWAVAGVLQFLSARLGTRRLAVDTGFERPPAPGEAALAIVESNPGARPEIEVERDDEGRVRFSARGASDLRDLSPLREFDVFHLELHDCTEVDWDTLLDMQPEILVLSGSEVRRVPLRNPRAFTRLREARLDHTGLESLDFLRSAPQLVLLDVSGTAVTDFSPVSSRRLRHLLMAGIEPANLIQLQNFPLETLVIGPPLLFDKAKLHPLRFHRTLHSIRAPGDPEDQPAAEFWRRLDSQEYGSGPGAVD